MAWARRHLPHGADSQVGRVVDRFALVALAGEIATEWGSVPWPAGQADWAAEVCLQAWLAQRVANCAGFRRRDGQDRVDDLFHAEGWKDACAGFTPKDVARACADAGLLEAVLESGKLRFQKNVKVPGRGTERFYLITGRGLEAYRLRLTEG